MKGNKIVLVILEGKSDQAALSIGLEKFFRPLEIRAHITKGDLTSDFEQESCEIVSYVKNQIDIFMGVYKVKKEDIVQVIHIVDTDGAYVSQDFVIFSEKDVKARYESDGIYTQHKAEIERRNTHKTECLNRLSKKKDIAGIKYQIYFMSCNLDHVISDCRNMGEGEAKYKNGHEFAKKYKGDLDGFIRFFCQSPFSCGKGYRESWDYIKTHSLERCTNLDLVLQQKASG